MHHANMRRYAVCALLNIAPAEGDDDGNAAQVAMGAGASSPQASRGEPRPGNGAAPPARGAGSSGNARPPSRAQAQVQNAQPDPAGALRQDGQEPASPAPPRQPAAAPPRTAKPQPVPDTPRRPKDEPSPPSVWGILRPSKAGITAPDGTAWLNWWTDVAGKAAAEGKRDWLRTLYELNTAAWDKIALGSPEANAVVAKAAEAVSSALGD